MLGTLLEVEVALKALKEVLEEKLSIYQFLTSDGQLLQQILVPLIIQELILVLLMSKTQELVDVLSDLRAHGLRVVKVSEESIELVKFVIVELVVV